MPEPEKEKHKRSFTQEERKAAMDLFNSFESGQFKVLVLEAGNDKNAEKGAAWDRFTAAFRELIKDPNISKKQMRDLVQRLRSKTTDKVTRQVEKESIKAVRRHAAYSSGTGGGPPLPPLPMISGDDLEQMDTMGNPGLIPSRGAATCFVTTDNGRTLFSHQIFQGVGADTGNQPSGSGIGAADAAVVQQASFVMDGQDLLGVEDDYQVMVDNAQVIVPENNHLSNSVSRELFPVSTGTPRQSRSARASAATVATPSVSGSRSRAGLTGSSVPQTTAALTTATDASADYFRTLSRNNTLMSRVRFLAYQSHLSVNRKREELLELQRLEQVERLKKLYPHVVIPSHKQSLFSYTNDLCTADPSELLYLDDEEEEASDGEQS